ncbi:Ltp family lipoprotein [Mycobacterium kansasii]
MSKKYFAGIVFTVLLGISGIAAGGAHGAPFEAGSVSQRPLSPVSQQSAVRAAQAYLSVSGFSRLGLINQLVSFDQFSNEDATYAVDSLNVNWNEQAARAAKAYLNVSGFSHAGLIDQLVSFDQFTPAQAAYGVNAVGL